MMIFALLDSFTFSTPLILSRCSNLETTALKAFNHRISHKQSDLILYFCECDFPHKTPCAQIFKGTWKTLKPMVMLCTPHSLLVATLYPKSSSRGISPMLLSY